MKGKRYVMEMVALYAENMHSHVTVKGVHFKTDHFKSYP